MPTWLIVLICIAAGLGVFLYLRFWNKKRKKALAMQSTANRINAISVNNFIHTPKGASVLYETGVSTTNQMLDALDTGLDQLFESVWKCAPQLDPEKKLTHGEFYFVILTSIFDSEGLPAFQLDAAQYKGTQYEHQTNGRPDGTVLVAGQFLLIENLMTPRVVLPAHQTNFAHLSNVAQYESEHQVLFYRDTAWYQRTETHSPSTAHPLISC